MTNSADQVVDAVQAWVDAYGDVLGLVWARFAPDAEWPEAAKLTRQRFSIQPRRDFTEIARNMPPQLGQLDVTGPQRIVLTARGLSYVADTQPLLDAFAQLVQIGVKRYTDLEGEAVIGAAELQGLLDIDARSARQLEELVVLDQWFFRLNGGTPGGGDLRIVVDERAVFCVAEARTIEDYLDAQMKAWYPEPGAPILIDEVPTPSALELTDEHRRDPRRVMVVHGRDLRARNDLFNLLRAIGLSPIEWSDAVRATGSGTPYTGEAVEAAFAIAQAAVVLCTPDEQVVLREELSQR